MKRLYLGVKLFSFAFLTSVVGNLFAGAPLVQRDNQGNIHAAEWFKSIQPDMLHLIKRSYTITKRDADDHFLHENAMLCGQRLFSVHETNHNWVCHRNFTGIHGNIEPTSFWRSCIRGCLCCCSLGQTHAEIDFPGFVAYKSPSMDCPHHVIAVVFRGSQGEDFQAGSGILGASWATNYDVVPTEVNPEQYGYVGQVHGGYLAKIDSCNYAREAFFGMLDEGDIRNPLVYRDALTFINPMNQSIQKTIDNIPAEERENIRFIVTGHSQGGGLAQIALPYIIMHFGEQIPGFENNLSTPRFFGYFLSGPRVVADQVTKENYTRFVGEDNMISHFAFRDVVTMAALRGFLTLGHLACDNAYDVVYRGICSEIAYNNRLLLMKYLKSKLDSSNFSITRDGKYWVSKTQNNLVISWHDIGHIISKMDDIYEHSIDDFPDMMVDVVNRALERYRKRTDIESDEALPFFMPGDLHFKDVDWGLLRRICSRNFVPQGVRLDAERCEVLRRLENNIYGDTVTFSQNGSANIRALADTVLDLYDAGRGRENPGGWKERLGRIFCCGGCCRSGEVSAPYVFDSEFNDLLSESGIDVENSNEAMTAGSVCLFVYLHYGSGANGYNAKLFDKYIPSRNLDFALHNGEIVDSQDSDYRLDAELHSRFSSDGLSDLVGGLNLPVTRVHLSVANSQRVSPLKASLVE